MLSWPCHASQHPTTMSLNNGLHLHNARAGEVNIRTICVQSIRSQPPQTITATFSLSVRPHGAPCEIYICAHRKTETRLPRAKVRPPPIPCSFHSAFEVALPQCCDPPISLRSDPVVVARHYPLPSVLIVNRKTSAAVASSVARLLRTPANTPAFPRVLD